ncbi:MAG: hypothetical protein ACHQU8_07865, partial [Gemmatimonadales bacterium]
HEMRAMVYAAAGDTAAAARELVSNGDTFLGPEPQLFIGQVDRALTILEAITSPALRCFSIRTPTFARLRGQPRFDRIAARCPVPEGQ